MPPLSMAWSYVVLAVVLIVAAVLDVRRGVIPNALTYPAIAAGLIGQTLAGGLWGDGASDGLAGALGGMAAGFLPMLAAWMAGGVGGGDAKLMAAVGALTNWKFALSALFFGLIVAAVMAIVVMIRRRVARRTLGRMWRALVLMVLSRQGVDPATPESPKVPIGLAFCIGALAAMAEAIIHEPGWLLKI